MSNYKVIDLENWIRKEHCEIFRKSAMPEYCVAFDVDITNFHEKIVSKGLSFTFSLIYTVARCADEIENFRYRFLDGDVVLYDEIRTSFTYLNKETELFKFVNIPLTDTIEEYVEVAYEKAEGQEEYFAGAPANDCYIFSALPWVKFTSISHTFGGSCENAVPNFDWGKFYEKHGKLYMPFSVKVHHSFVDGYHIGKFAENLQKHLDSFK